MPELVQLTKNYEEAAQRALVGFEHGTLPAGADLVLGLKDDYAVAVNMGLDVPFWAESAVVDLCSDIREHFEARARSRQAPA